LHVLAVPQQPARALAAQPGGVIIATSGMAPIVANGTAMKSLDKPSLAHTKLPMDDSGHCTDASAAPVSITTCTELANTADHGKCTCAELQDPGKNLGTDWCANSWVAIPCAKSCGCPCTNFGPITTSTGDISCDAAADWCSDYDWIRETCPLACGVCSENPPSPPGGPPPPTPLSPPSAPPSSPPLLRQLQVVWTSRIPRQNPP